MNITIYFLSKKIVIKSINQSTENQSFKNIDELKKSEIVDEFEKFANETNNILLTFVTQNIEKGFDKFRKAFIYIYAAGGLIEKDGKYLFIYRLKCWDLPKGKLDMGETPEEASIRECEEECGITKLSITKTLDPTYHMYSYKGSYALKKTYWYAMTTLHVSDLTPQLEENIELVEWFTVDQIKSIVLQNSYPAILSVIEHLLT